MGKTSARMLMRAARTACIVLISHRVCAHAFACARIRTRLRGPNGPNRSVSGSGRPRRATSVALSQRQDAMPSKSCHKVGLHVRSRISLRLRKGQTGLETNTPIKIAAVLWITCVYYPCGYAFHRLARSRIDVGALQLRETMRQSDSSGYAELVPGEPGRPDPGTPGIVACFGWVMLDLACMLATGAVPGRLNEISDLRDGPLVPYRAV